MASALKQGDLLHNIATLTAKVRNFTNPRVATGYTQSPFVQSDFRISINPSSFTVVTYPSCASDFTPFFLEYEFD